MKFIKKMVAVMIIACTAMSFTACQDTTWVYDYSSSKITSGLYIAQTMNAYAQAQNHKDIKPEIKDLLKQKLDGKLAKQWIEDKAKENCDKYVAIENKFTELKLTFTEKYNNIIKQNLETGWESLGKIYEKNSVSEDTYKMIVTNQQKQAMIFETYYGKGGIEEITNDKLLVHFKDNFASVNVLALNLEVGDKLTDEQTAKNKETKSKAEEYVKLINESNKTFNEVKDIHKHFVAKDTHKADDKDDVIDKDSETKVYIKKDSTSPSEKVVKAIFNDVKTDEKAVLIPDTNAYYVCVRYDVTKDPKTFDDMRDQILFDVKGADFEKLTDKWASEIASSAKANTAAVKRYKAKNIDLKDEK